jgi:exopolysaccharide biosynthesis polyprenyl glycosylphosphotransferase
MISQRIRGLYSLLILIQLWITVAAYWAHFYIITQFYSEVVGPQNYILYCFLVLLGVLIESIHRYSYDTDWFQKGLLHKYRISLRQMAFAAAPVIFFLVAKKDQAISRVFLFTFLPVLHLTLFVSAWKLPHRVARFIFRDARIERTLLVGSYRNAVALRPWLQQKEQLGLHTVGLICEESFEGPWKIPVLGNFADLERVIRDSHITQVVLVELPLDAAQLNQISLTCEHLGVRLLVKSDLDQKFRHPIIYMENDGLHFFGLREEPLENPFNRFMKRVVDVAVSAVVVAGVLPFTTALVWLMQRSQSPGPLFYLQNRAGLQNRQFRIFKYRTMRPDNPDVTRQATLNDDRIFPAGHWMRKYSIDELPQFLNVLLGEMSVVGPRPHLPEHNEQFSRVMENYYVRAFVKPGITGLAQVRGFRGEARNETMLKKRIESDIYYLEHWSLSADLWIIVRTVSQVVAPPNTAY